MSQEFDALRQNSIVPDWLEESDLQNYWLLEMAGTHGEEQAQVAYVQSRMGQGRRPMGVLPLIAHRQASESGQRHIGPKQLMACYPGSFDPKASLEQQVAAGITWGTRQLPANHLVIDRHDCIPHPWDDVNRYAAVGARTTTAAIAAAFIMQHEDIQFARWSTFRNEIPRSVLVDEAPRHTRSSASRDWDLEHIAKLGPEGLHDLYYQERLGLGLVYYESVLDVLLVDPDTGQPNHAVLSVLPELERSGTIGYSSEGIDLSDEALETLGLPPGQYVTFSGGYHNRSQLIDNYALGLPDDTERRLCWGELARQHPGPRRVPGTDYLTFRQV
jgi:hypothetical protein